MKSKAVRFTFLCCRSSNITVILLMIFSGKFEEKEVLLLWEIGQ